MQQSIGSYIRQLRRQRSLTQSELGENRFSKSYVSAVERGTILPSSEALRFFAEQFEQPIDTFEQLAQKDEQNKQIVSLSIAESSQHAILHQEYKEIVDLLDMMLDGTELSYSFFTSMKMLPALSHEVLAELPSSTQVRYFFLQGLIAEKKREYAAAVAAFEQALVVATIKHRPAILDTLGNTYFQMHLYHISLSYYQRALQLLYEQMTENVFPALLLSVEAHCGDTYRALGLHNAAYQHYEKARQYLRPTDNIQIAGSLYGGLGYCIYASIYQGRLDRENKSETLSSEEQEQRFQKAISFLLQSRTLYQVGSEQLEEARMRLIYTMVVLDHCLFRKQKALETSKQTKKPPIIYGTAQIDDAENQCRQVLLNQQDKHPSSSSPAEEIQGIIYTALAYRIRIATLRATIARITGFADTAIRERSFATYLCQMVLESLAQPEFSWKIVNDAMSLSLTNLSSHIPALPPLPKLSLLEMQERWQPGLLAEVFFAAGEIAEEIGRAASSEEYASESYQRVNVYLHTALQIFRQAIPDYAYDITYLTRSYMRSATLLEERIEAFPSLEKETTQVLIGFLKEGLTPVQQFQPYEQSAIDVFFPIKSAV